MKSGMKALSMVAAFSVFGHVWASDVMVNDPWIAEAPPGAFAVGAFMTLKNADENDRTLSAVSTDKAERVEMHATILKDGVASMVEQETLTVPAAGEFVLKPGGYHIMLIRPQALKAGDKVDMTLTFANGQTQSVTAEVRKRMSGGHDHMHHNHH